MRDKEGVVFKRCSGTEQYWLGTGDHYIYKACKGETTLHNDTAPEYSKYPYHYWIYVIAFLASSKKLITDFEMQRTLGHKFYFPIWAMLHKLRITMGHRDATYRLSGFVEADDAQLKCPNLKWKPGTTIPVQVQKAK